MVSATMETLLKMRDLIIVRGLPGSGKSTLAGRILSDCVGVVVRHYEADHYFINKNTGLYEFDKNRLMDAHRWCQDMTRAALAREEVVIVSNTFTTKKELAPYFEMIQEYGQDPTVYLCENNWGSIHDVPQLTLEAMKKRFQFDISDMFLKETND